jgi:chromate transporter
MILNLFLCFLHIGSVSFGGYMSMVAVIRRQLVDDKNLMPAEAFSEGLALASILPGPVAVNLAAYCGFILSGLPGALVAVSAVLLPSFSLMVLLFHVVNISGSVSYVAPLVFFASGVAFAVILSAGISTFKKYCKSGITISVAFLTMVILYMVPGYFMIISLLFAFALAGQFMSSTGTESAVSGPQVIHGKIVQLLWPAGVFVLCAVLGSFFFPALVFREFAKVGLTLFGGGYVVVPLLNASLVENLNWINQSDLLTGISLGQLTPGPILISAAFFGQKIAGFPGAVAATAGIFLPAALIMIFCTYYLQQIRASVFFMKALNLILPFVSGLIIVSGFQILFNAWKSHAVLWHFIWWGIAFAGVHFLKINTILMIGLAISAGLLTLIF